MCNEEYLKMNCILNLGLTPSVWKRHLVVVALFLLFEEIHLGISDLVLQTFSM